MGTFALVWWVCQRSYGLETQSALAVATVAATVVGAPLAWWASREPPALSSPASIAPSSSPAPADLHGPVIMGGAVVAPPRAEQTLPADVTGFVGRQDELQRLLDAADGPVRAVAIHAVDGMAGVGKTAFAVHAAHALAARFPDGRLFVELRAHKPGQARVDPVAALATLLQADGIAAQQIPAGLDARAGLWRDRMAAKRVLLVLDDAADTAHVAPLLPGAPGCLVLITSRRKLTTLPEAAFLSLDILPPEQARELFAARAGARAGGDPATVERITRLCGYLPLAITLTAARLHTHPLPLPPGPPSCRSRPSPSTTMNRPPTGSPANSPTSPPSPAGLPPATALWPRSGSPPPYTITCTPAARGPWL
jgi:hypothetical protein